MEPKRMGVWGRPSNLELRVFMGGEGTPEEASEVETLIVETKIERLSGQKLYHGLADIPATPSAWGFHPLLLPQ